jgi:hypothetical protein
MTEENTTQEVPLDEDGLAVLPACQKHGIHNASLAFDIPGHGQIHFCALCMIERLDGLGVHRMSTVKLTKEQFEEMKAKAEADLAAASELSQLEAAASELSQLEAAASELSQLEAAE